MIIEIRHLGGAFGDPKDAAVRGIDGEYALLAVQPVAVPEFSEHAAGLVAGAIETMRPWADCAPYLNFIDAPLDAATAFDLETLERLHRVRAQYDPDRVWLAAHALPEVEAV